MSDNLIVVGLPREEEAVNQISSEKVAHVTLLYLGEASDASAEIIQYIEHVVTTSFQPIYLEVSDRGTLGDKEADVLFFAGPGARQLTAFRSLLLKNQNVQKLHIPNDNFPTFTPHLTLGYPETPANEPENSWGLHGFEIDRIAVWDGDYEGIEFKVPYHELTDSVAWGDQPKDASLWHYGKKGMKWGVINDDDGGGSGGGAKEDKASRKAAADAEFAAMLADYEKKADDISKDSGLDSANLKAKYGPPPTPEQKAAQSKADHDQYKDLAVKAGIGIGIAALAYGAYKYAPEGTPVVDFARTVIKENTLLKTNMAAYGNARDGLAINWDKGVDIPKGGVLKRLGSVAETEKRPGGFFACYRDEDVESYKAILPTFWRGWGVGSPSKGGYLNHYRADASIKAPSGKESFETFKDLLKTNKEYHSLFQESPGQRVYEKGDDYLKDLFKASSQHWIDDQGAIAKPYLDAIKAKGYNALIDFNDAGKLGKTPLRVLDSDPFTIVKNEKMGLNDFHKAAKNWKPELIHMVRQKLGGVMDGELWHYGVKGMKWGRRKSESSGSSVSKTTDSQGNTVIGIGKDKGPQGVKATSVRLGPKTEVRTAKGGYHEAHPDAVAAKSAAQKKKSSGVDTLSNKELNALAERMNLEQRIRDLEERRPDSPITAGQKYIQRELATEGLKHVASNHPMAKLGQVILKASQPKTGKKQNNQNNNQN